MFEKSMTLRDHAFGALSVAFVGSIATMLMAVMARVGPEIFSQLTRGLAVLTLIAVGAAAIMLAVLVVRSKR